MTVFKRGMQWLFGLLFIMAGIYHFIHADFYVKIMPPYLPWHLQLVYLSGICEMILGILLLIPVTTSLAAWGLIALLIAVFPANLHMAFYAERYAEYNPILLWLRLPVQGLLIAWAYWFTRKSN